MNTEKLNSWLTVATNIGVIAGLVLLAYEVSQTNEALERDAATFQMERVANLSAQMSSAWSSIVQNEDVADIWVRGSAGESLNSVERERFRRIADGLFFSAANVGDGTLGAVALYPDMRTRPGLRAQFDEWANNYPLPFVGHYREFEASKTQ